MHLPGFLKNTTVQVVLAAIAVIIVVYLVSKHKETFAPFVENTQEDAVAPPTAPESMASGEVGAEVDYSQSTGAPVKPEELLPQQPKAPEGASEGLAGQNFVFTSGFGLGINTVGSSMRNANLQLRSEPANPVVQVSPWLQSTITPDFSRKSFEIGN